MKSLESNLWGWLKRAGDKPEFAGRLHYHRVENSVETGCPDLEACLDGRPFWTELKTVAAPTGNAGIKVKITADQVDWARKRWRVGGASWVLVRVGHKEHFLLPGKDLREMLKTVPYQWFVGTSGLPSNLSATQLWVEMSTRRSTLG